MSPRYYIYRTMNNQVEYYTGNTYPSLWTSDSRYKLLFNTWGTANHVAQSMDPDYAVTILPEWEIPNSVKAVGNSETIIDNSSLTGSKSIHFKDGFIKDIYLTGFTKDNDGNLCLLEGVGGFVTSWDNVLYITDR